MTISSLKNYDETDLWKGGVKVNSKQFLLLGGAILVLVGILGFVGVIGPTPDKSLFGEFWWFDNPENIAHTVLGLAGLGAAFVLPAIYQKYLVLLLGVLGVVVGLYSLAVGVALLGANLENPADTILHLVVGAWALFASLMGDKTASAPKQS